MKNQLKRKPGSFTPLWKLWTVQEGKKCDGLNEGENGPREMSNLMLTFRVTLASIDLQG